MGPGPIVLQYIYGVFVFELISSIWVHACLQWFLAKAGPIACEMRQLTIHRSGMTRAHGPLGSEMVIIGILFNHGRPSNGSMTHCVEYVDASF